MFMTCHVKKYFNISDYLGLKANFLFFPGQCMKLGQPDFMTPLRNLTIEVGRNATFECFVTGIEKYRVSEQGI